MAKVKGSKITSKFAFVKEYYGDQALDSLLASMDDEDARALIAVIEAGWYPQDLYERLLKAICSHLAVGDEAIFTRIGHHSAQHLINSTYKVFQSKDPLRLLKNQAPMHTMMNQPGEMEVSSNGPGHCTIKVASPRSSAVICKCARAFYHKAVELCGVTKVSVTEPKCSGNGDNYCQFEITWK